MTTVHLLIKGKVQGVFYRASAKEIADILSVTGWIRNTNDGDVEAMITGTNDQLDRFIAWCYKGPAKAKVDAIIKNSVEATFFEGFKIMRK